MPELKIDYIDGDTHKGFSVLDDGLKHPKIDKIIATEIRRLITGELGPESKLIDT